MQVCTPTFSAHRPSLWIPRQIFEDATGYVPSESKEAIYADRVNEASGIVYGVKILGIESRNTPRTIGETYETVGDYLDVPYRYSLEAMREAIPLFEGIKVLNNHPQFKYTARGERFAPPQERDTDDTFGRIVNVRVTSEGMFGDHEYLKSDPFAPKYVEIARRMPNVLAFSPSANGVLRVVNAKPTIVKITDVRSVDLVGERPGTTSSLFESESRMADAVMEPEVKDAKETHEDDAPPMTTGATDTMAEDAPDGDPSNRDHFDAAFEKEVIDIWNGEGTAQEKAKKISQLAKKQDEIAGIRGAADQATDDADEDDDLDLEETADPSAEADRAAAGVEGIDPKSLSETGSECATGKDDKAMNETKAKLHETAAQLAKATRLLETAKKRLKTVRAEAAARETAIYETVDLLNAANKPVRSGTLRIASREPDKKVRERFIAETVAKRPTTEPRSEQRAPGGDAGKPLHETTAQTAGAKSSVDEMVVKGDAKAIAEFLRA